MGTLSFIVAANLASTAVSLTLAALFSFRLLAHLVDRLVHVSIGLLLATALVHIMPEALAAGLAPRDAGWTLLLGILGLFVLEKMTLIHHTHPQAPNAEGEPRAQRHDHGHQHGHGHVHPGEHGQDARQGGRGAYPILIADAFHNFTDGIVIAAAFLADARAGVIAALAVMAHEIPHEIGDFMILLNAGFSRRRAFAFMALSGGSAVLGGVAGYFVLAMAQALLPYALALAAASFIYIALSDLLPELMRRSSLRQSLPEVAYVLCGVAVALAAAHIAEARGLP